MQRDVLAKIPQSDLQVYSVWVPMLWTDGKGVLPQATKRFADPRVRHYSDGERKLVAEYSRVLEIDESPWDVYLLFDRNAEWKDRAPKPVFWMDRLGLEKGTPCDGMKLGQKVRELLDAPLPK